MNKVLHCLSALLIGILSSGLIVGVCLGFAELMNYLITIDVVDKIMMWFVIFVVIVWPFAFIACMTHLAYTGITAWKKSRR